MLMWKVWSRLLRVRPRLRETVLLSLNLRSLRLSVMGLRDLWCLNERLMLSAKRVLLLLRIVLTEVRLLLLLLLWMYILSWVFSRRLMLLFRRYITVYVYRGVLLTRFLIMAVVLLLFFRFLTRKVLVRRWLLVRVVILRVKLRCLVLLVSFRSLTMILMARVWLGLLLVLLQVSGLLIVALIW